MSTNDDSISRRGRQTDAGNQQWRSQNPSNNRDNQWSQSYRDQGRGKQGEAIPTRPDRNDETKRQFSNFRYDTPPRPENRPPVPAQRQPEPVQDYAPPRRAPDNHHEDDDDRHIPSPPHQSYPMDYRDDENDLYERDSNPPPVFEQPLYSTQRPSQAVDNYNRNLQHIETQQPSLRTQPAAHPQHFVNDAPSAHDEYDQSFAPVDHDPPPRFFSRDDHEADRKQPELTTRHHGTSQTYDSGQQEHEKSSYDDYRYENDHDNEHDTHNYHANVPQRISHDDELDEDFFADEDDADQEDSANKPKKKRLTLIAATLVGAIAIGGGATYYLKSKTTSSINNVNTGMSLNSSMPVIQADNRPAKDVPANPGGKQFANGEKAIYDRLTPGNSASSMQSAYAPGTPSQNTSSNGNSLEDRIGEAVRKAQRSGESGPSGSTVSPSSATPGSDKPNIVHSEIYRPDGTRVETNRPTETMNIASMNSNQLPPPFGNSSNGVVSTPSSGTPFRSSVPPAPAAVPARAAAPAPVPVVIPAPVSAPAPIPAPKVAALTAAPPVQKAAGESAYYVQLASSVDEKASDKRKQDLVNKYGSVLSDAQFDTKAVDMGDKGVQYKLRAGPYASRQDATDICTKLKTAGLAANGCFVPKAE